MDAPGSFGNGPQPVVAAVQTVQAGMVQAGAGQAGAGQAGVMAPQASIINVTVPVPVLNPHPHPPHVSPAPTMLAPNTLVVNSRPLPADFLIAPNYTFPQSSYFTDSTLDFSVLPPGKIASVRDHDHPLDGNQGRHRQLPHLGYFVNEDRLGPRGSVWTWPSRKLAVKISREPSLITAGRTMVVVKRFLPSVPVPEVYGWRTVDMNQMPMYLLYMELIDGGAQTVDELWDSQMSGQDKISVVDQLAEMVNVWRRLEQLPGGDQQQGGPAWIGALTGEPPTDPMIKRLLAAPCNTPSVDAHGNAKDGFPPFPGSQKPWLSNVKMLHLLFHWTTFNTLEAAGPHYGHSRFKEASWVYDLSCLGTCEPGLPAVDNTPQVPVVFTHGNLSPKNVLVRRDYTGNLVVVGILGWTCAGWYPAYWECLKASWLLKQPRGPWTRLPVPWLLPMQLMKGDNAPYAVSFLGRLPSHIPEPPLEVKTKWNSIGHLVIALYAVLDHKLDLVDGRMYKSLKNEWEARSRLQGWTPPLRPAHHSPALVEAHEVFKELKEEGEKGTIVGSKGNGQGQRNQDNNNTASDAAANTDAADADVKPDPDAADADVKPDPDAADADAADADAADVNASINPALYAAPENTEAPQVATEEPHLKQDGEESLWDMGPWGIDPMFFQLPEENKG